MLKRTFRIGLINILLKIIYESGLGKKGKDDFTMSQLWFLEGLPGLEPHGG